MSGLSQPALTAITPFIRTPVRLTAIGDRATLSAACLSAPAPGITAGAMAITGMATMGTATATRVTDITAGATGIGPAMLTEAVTMVTPMAASAAMRAVDSAVVVAFTEVKARTEAVATAK